MSAYASLFVAMLAAAPGLAGAQTMYKCMKGNAVTYTNSSCETLGLKSAGPVRDRMTTLPMGGQAKGAAAPAGKAQSSIAKENQIDMPATSTIKPVNPLIEKLAK